MVAKKADRTPSNLRGLIRLVTEAAIGVTNVAEHTHVGILRFRPFAPAEGQAAPGLTGLVYRCVRGVVRLAGATIDAALAQFSPQLVEMPPSPACDASLAALNGVAGDYLVETDNPLALTIQMRRNGRALTISKQALAELAPTGRLVVLVHGLCVSDLRWGRSGRDHGEMLARELGFTPVYLFYNSGLHISTNGHAVAEILENLIAQWPRPIEELVLIGHSMGGLVARSACHYGELAGHGWRRRVGKLICLGSPHHGAPLERIGAWVDGAIAMIPFGAAFTRLGKIRSAGVTDLRFGNLLDEDWQGRDRFARDGDKRTPVPLPEGVACYAVAATTGLAAGGLNDRLIGDGLVTVDSALGRHKDPALALAFLPHRQWIGCGMNHFDLLDRVEVYERIALWLAP